MNADKSSKEKGIRIVNLIEKNPEMKKHLRLFIKSFIKKEYVERWEYLIFSNPEKATHQKHKFDDHKIGRLCKYHKYSDFNNMNLDEITGFYYDGYECKYTKLSEIQDPFRDSIFSVKAGEKAYFFFHEFWFWECTVK